MSKLFYLAFFFTVMVASEVINYHVRHIYLSEKDNVCSDNGHDELHLEIKFSDRSQILEKTISGLTECREFALFKYQAIAPSNFACYSEENPHGGFDELYFVQETKSEFIGGLILAMNQKLSIKEEAVFDKEKYDCNIVGDGKIEHWGPKNDRPAPTVKVLCSKKSQQSNLQTM